MIRIKAIFSLLVLCLTLPAAAVPYTGGAGFTIPDPGTGSSTIVISSSGIITSFDSLSITVSQAHIWSGDLTAVITSPTGVSVQLFRRPGNSIFGNSGDWLIGTTTFVETGGLSSPTVDDPEMDWGNFTYNRTSNPGSPAGPAVNPNTFASFVGLSLNGTWTLSINDAVSGADGAISGWSMNITSFPVPEMDPGTACLPMLSLLLGLGILRDRRAATSAGAVPPVPEGPSKP